MRYSGLLLAAALPLAVAAPAQAADAGTGTVSGKYFMDRNGDGQQQADEPGPHAGFVELLTTDGRQVAHGSPDEQGFYEFGDVAPGDYQVRFNEGGFLPTTPNNVPVSVQDGGTAQADFGMQGGEISGMAWEDSNGDGQRQQGEPPIAGVEITSIDGAQYRATTGEDGTYRIADAWINKDYRLTFQPREGMMFAPPRVGAPETDSDVIDADDGSAEASVWVGKPGFIINAHNIDAGYVPPRG
ncbi:MAG: TonB-dependent receptor [Saccharopolyspora sp.]|uniref:SdrD B-like domain-containing protein n=1 Tax=Saccharopolyspora TaxID=1835 RepID=UPI00190DD267|nr:MULTISPECIES: SdrD B-like domain-containing protein [unclassified Saccharopolyspora]MBK0869571.1 TonB-dependent receptor [Saccharopolyspora sp. HNM0986]MBQ6642232.1 TonB-dependent receptor [Saccharopolyspora sp.]